MLGMKVPRRFHSMDGIEPGAGPLGLRIAASNLIAGGEPPPMSFLEDEPAPPVSSNGHAPLEVSYSATLRRLLTQTRFGTLDLILIDLAPGLGELLRIARIAPLSAAIIVTQPSEISVHASRAGARNGGGVRDPGDGPDRERLDRLQLRRLPFGASADATHGDTGCEWPTPLVFRCWDVCRSIRDWPNAVIAA